MAAEWAVAWTGGLEAATTVALQVRIEALEQRVEDLAQQIPETQRRQEEIRRNGIETAKASRVLLSCFAMAVSCLARL